MTRHFEVVTIEWKDAAHLPSRLVYGVTDSDAEEISNGQFIMKHSVIYDFPMMTSDRAEAEQYRDQLNKQQF